MNFPMYINVAAVSLTKSTTHRPKGQWHHLNRAPQSPLSLRVWTTNHAGNKMVTKIHFVDIYISF